jgi:hypothetical protein
LDFEVPEFTSRCELAGYDWSSAMTNTHSDLTAESPYKGWRANRRLLSEQVGVH